MTGFRAGVGPFPLPFFHHCKKPTSTSRRVRQRHNVTSAAIRLANRSIFALNNLSSSFSTTFSSFSHANNSRFQSRLLDFVFESCLRFVRRRDGGSQSGDKYSCILTDDEAVTSLDDYHALEQSAVPIVADQVALPSDPGGVHLLDLLPDGMAKQYSSPCCLIDEHLNLRKKRVRPSVFASSTEYIKLVLRMKNIGMLNFLRPDDVKSVCGMFGVRKDDGSIRLIIDARSTNTKFKEAAKVCLPTPDILCRLHVPAHVQLTVAKIDIDNFYHRLRLPDWLCSYFALPPVRAVDVGLGDVYGENIYIHPCCNTLPMGWSHSVLLAQTAHEYFIDHYTTRLRDACRLTRSDNHNLTELSGLSYTCYIDDLSIFSTNPDESNQAIDEYLEAASKMRLKIKTSKLVRPTAEAESCGIHIDGVDHTVGVSPAKLWKLCKETRAVIERGHCTGDEMRRLVGKWSWCILARRPAFAVFNAVYRFSVVARDRRFSLWPTVRTELSTICGLAPLLFTKLDVDFFRKVVATDASTSGMGVVASRSDEQFMVDLARKTSKHGCAEMTTLEEKNIGNMPWTDIVSSPWRDQDEHINVLELRAVATAVRWVLSHPSGMCSRLLLLCDSQAVIPCVLRGRSSSFNLLCRLRPLAAFELASGLQIFIRYVRSAVNPADEPSRRFQ